MITQRAKVATIRSLTKQAMEAQYDMRVLDILETRELVLHDLLTELEEQYDGNS